MTTKRIEYLTPGLIIQIANLFERVDGRTCNVATYISYIYRNFNRIALFGVFDRHNSLVGYTHAEPPHPLEPEIAYLPFSSSTKECGHEMAMKAVELAEEWMKQFGATRWKMETTRNTKAMSKLWPGLEVSKETLMIKRID